MQFDRLKRRTFITLLVSAAAWPLVARAQQPAMLLVRRINDTAMNLSAVRVNAGRRRFHGR
jgi:putative ABC transport system substrate-binding protein